MVKTVSQVRVVQRKADFEIMIKPIIQPFLDWLKADRKGSQEWTSGFRSIELNWLGEEDFFHPELGNRYPNLEGAYKIRFQGFTRLELQVLSKIIRQSLTQVGSRRPFKNDNRGWPYPPFPYIVVSFGQMDSRFTIPSIHFKQEV